jgi:hypothetical protein
VIVDGAMLSLASHCCIPRVRGINCVCGGGERSGNVGIV